MQDDVAQDGQGNSQGEPANDHDDHTRATSHLSVKLVNSAKGGQGRHASP